ncbi:hypothetical protein N9A04_00160 [Rickettsiales bacterium]|nr:hypothetical protein [Rickettsiales bacterium]
MILKKYNLGYISFKRNGFNNKSFLNVNIQLPQRLEHNTTTPIKLKNQGTSASKPDLISQIVKNTEAKPNNFNDTIDNNDKMSIREIKMRYANPNTQENMRQDHSVSNSNSNPEHDENNVYQINQYQPSHSAQIRDEIAMNTAPQSDNLGTAGLVNNGNMNDVMPMPPVNSGVNDDQNVMPMSPMNSGVNPDQNYANTPIMNDNNDYHQPMNAAPQNDNLGTAGLVNNGNMNDVMPMPPVNSGVNDDQNVMPMPPVNSGVNDDATQYQNTHSDIPSPTEQDDYLSSSQQTIPIDSLSITEQDSSDGDDIGLNTSASFDENAETDSKIEQINISPKKAV